MRLRWVTMVLILSLGGCAWFSDPPRYSVFFLPYSSELDPQARQTIGEAASFAQSHGWLPIQVVGFSAPPDPARDVDGLSGQRAEAVKQLLIDDGVGANRIVVVANGVVDPKPLPSLAARRVDIAFSRTGQ